jgi:hypothetical protein
VAAAEVAVFAGCLVKEGHDEMMMMMMIMVVVVCHAGPNTLGVQSFCRAWCFYDNSSAGVAMCYLQSDYVN